MTGCAHTHRDFVLAARLQAERRVESGDAVHINQRHAQTLSDPAQGFLRKVAFLYLDVLENGYQKPPPVAVLIDYPVNIYQ